MADVNQVPGLPQDPSRAPKEPAKPSTEKFKDLMKVGDSEKKQKKQKKRQEEEAKGTQRMGAPTPEKVIKGVERTGKAPKIQEISESEKRQPKQSKRDEDASAIDEAAAVNLSREKIQSLNLEQVETVSLEKGAPTRPSYEAVPQQMQAEEKVAEEEKKEDQQVAIRREVKKGEKTQQAPQFVQPPSSALGPHFIAPAPESPPAYTALRAEMLAFFERMVGQIVVMQANGNSETTIHLNTPQFASSIFAGAQITIKEFSTAPLAYNIEFLGSPQSTLYFEQNIASLRAAFASEKRNYTINRIDSRLQREEKPLFHRKEKASDKDEESDQ
jgi:hypothetical protein